MRKKLMAAAVAGALAAPAGAYAASANVDFYGYFNLEYGFHSQPDVIGDGVNPSSSSGDAFNSGASRMGFRARENLGGGLNAWAQCETQINGVFGPGTGQSGLCNRNSAVGLQGSFGNVYFGRWDSAMKKANGAVRMLNEAGWTGAANLMVQGVSPTGVEFDFSLRNAFSINYDSPNWGGFRLYAQTTTTNASLNATSNANVDGRRSSIAGVYRGGPLTVTAAYEEHTDNTGISATSDGDKENNFQVGARYRLGEWQFGLAYNKMEAESGAINIERDSYNLAVQWDFAGPGRILAGYTMSNDWEGTLGTPDSGGSQWQVGYLHSFSKRTTGGIIVAGVDNDTNGVWNFTNLDQGPGTIVPGEGGTVVVLRLVHTF
jgi:predicted porin